ncbi:MAG: beta galactosidase jelly roll domain-containing protein [Arenibacter algicola]|nr:beta galactosidase jelly roll domain-containing protein [Arenibacter algicola]
MSEDALKPFDTAYNTLQRFKDPDLISKIEQKDQKRQQDWFALLNEMDKGFVRGSEWFLKDYNDDTWSSMQVPGYWEDQGLPNIDGVVWFRRSIEIPQNMVDKEAKLWLGRSVDQDHVYVNGTFIGSTGYQYPPRKYKIPKKILVPGKNTITIRLINQQGKGGFIMDKPYFLSVGNDSIDLKGSWKYQLGTIMEPLPNPTFIRWQPAGLFNSMIAPLLNYKIKGTIWYQGESNTQNPKSYYHTFPTLINNWRARWNMGDFPFIYVQLANYMEEAMIPSESQWAELRHAQLNTLKLANTGMVVATDLGEWNDIHPLNKESVGQRLALNAQKVAYNENVVNSGPIFKSSEIKDNQIIISFKAVGGGLIANDGLALRQFQISGPDENFVWADAKIVGNTVVVKNDSVANPTYVRYAWADNPFGANLYNKEGLPAAPFRNYNPEP